MKHTIYSILLILLVWLAPCQSHAQTDPALAGMILEFTEKAKSQYNTQLETMGMSG